MIHLLRNNLLKSNLFSFKLRKLYFFPSLSFNRSFYLHPSSLNKQIHQRKQSKYMKELPEQPVNPIL